MNLKIGPTCKRASKMVASLVKPHEGAALMRHGLADAQNGEGGSSTSLPALDNNPEAVIMVSR